MQPGLHRENPPERGTLSAAAGFLPVYRLCILGSASHASIESVFPCADDDSAEAEARKLAVDKDAELWKAGRMIARFRQTVPKKAPPKRGAVGHQWLTRSELMKLRWLCRYATRR
jgi:hypothetical protein